MENVFYLECRGGNDKSMPGDIQNHRVDCVERTEVKYKGKIYDLFFEFTQCKHWHYRTKNKRTGAPLKNPVYETIANNSVCVHTEFKEDKDNSGYKSSYGLASFEQEMWAHHFDYTKKSILEIVNKYKTGAKFTRVCIIDQEARAIIEKRGGYREKEILKNDCVFSVGGTWNKDYKTVRVFSRTLQKSCEVELISGQITG